MSAEAPAAIGDTIADKYELVRPLGEGGMGTVYLAEHVLTHRRVALKLVPQADPMMRERLLREARSLGRLTHPNVVGVLDMGQWGSAVFLVMEYIHGSNLRQYTQGQRLEPEQAIPLLLPACSGVAAAHQSGILHRDLKPENLFVCTDRDGTAFDTKVLDFGVAKHLGEAEGTSTLTDQGSIIGTPKYMAPEQLDEESLLTEQTDVYALALILYEMLAGRLPYETTGLRNIVIEILRGQLTPLHVAEPSIPEPLSAIVMRGLSADAPDRHPGVADFARALEPWAGSRRFVAPRDVQTSGGAGGSMPPPSMPSSARPPAGVTVPSPRPVNQPINEAITAVIHTPRGGSAAPATTGAVTEDADAPRRRPWAWLLIAAVAIAVVLWTLRADPSEGERIEPAAGQAAPAASPPPTPDTPTPTQPPTTPPSAPAAVEPAPAAEQTPRQQPPVVAAPRPSTTAAPDTGEPAPQSKPARARPQRPARPPTPKPAASKPARTTHPSTDNRDPWAQ